MKTAVELFFVTPIPEGFHYIRKELDITQEFRDPDSVVKGFLEYFFSDSRLITDKERYILHSTSWRFEATKKIVLTYIVYSEYFTFSHSNPAFLQFSEISISQSEDPHTPRPKVITQNAVLSHALRHLAFLLANDTRNMYANIITSKTKDVFTKMHNEVSGEFLCEG